MNRFPQRVPGNGGDNDRAGLPHQGHPNHGLPNQGLPNQKVRLISDTVRFLFGKQLSPWSRSSTKRLFDCVCVVWMMPLLIPILATVGLAVRLTSSGPVLFLQKRTGRNGRPFTILKFRTMIHTPDNAHKPVTTCGNQMFTPVGPFLRRWKLDELPQLFNVLAGHMSLVGPRPKLAAHAISSLPCRAGITGAATVAFAREESILDRVPKQHLDAFYHAVVLPAKLRLDAEYMAKATFMSDLQLIVRSVFRRWDNTIIEDLLFNWASKQSDGIRVEAKQATDAAFAHAQMVAQMDRNSPHGEIRVC
jgi:lipopolysaccharide/colanic/teichoic acid biosynthesis glycosyltransferase